MQEESQEPVPTDTRFSVDQLDHLRKWGYVTESGVVYHEELVGGSGMSFVLLREEATTQAQLDASVKQLRSTRDVVGAIRVTRFIVDQHVIKIVEAPKRMAILETKMRYVVLLNGEFFDEISFNTTGYLGELPLLAGEGDKLCVGERGISLYRKEASAINAQAKRMFNERRSRMSQANSQKGWV